MKEIRNIIIVAVVSSAITYVFTAPGYSEKYYTEVIKACEGTLEVYQTTFGNL